MSPPEGQGGKGPGPIPPAGSGHLIERFASRLRGVGGLTSAPAAPVPAADEALPPGPPAKPPPREGAKPLAARFEELTAAVAGQDAALPGDGDAALAEHPADGERAGDGEMSGDERSAEAERRARRPAPEPIRPWTGAPVGLGTTMPGKPVSIDWDVLAAAGLAVGQTTRTRIAEEYRIAAGRVLRAVRASYAPGRGAGNGVMVTSARPGEGKSFNALNLAGSLAQHTPRNVMLVDIDAKERPLSADLGLDERMGLLDLAADPSLRAEDLVLQTAIPRLSVLPIGSRRAHTPDLAAASPVTALIERLARRFPNHLLLLDAPPCLSTSDPSSFAPVVGLVVMIVEAEKTQRSEVMAALDLVRGCENVMLMLNKIKLTTSYTFGAYHYFGTYT
jgi:receptor protein-tyrosine kinase